MKRIFNILFLLVAFIFIGSVNAAAVPTYDNTKGAFFANGVAIDVNAPTFDVSSLTSDTTLQELVGKACGGLDCTSANSGAVIVYNNSYVYVPASVAIFGGGKEASVATSTINVKGGSIAWLFGGGQGSTTVNANVDTVVINITDGNVTNRFSAGGYLNSIVKTSTVTMTGGVVKRMHGGGYGVGQTGLYYAQEYSGTEEHPELSKTVVDKVTLNLSGGTVTNILFGGGLGYAYTKEAIINISGTFNAAGYVTAGGSNGRTDKGTINVSGGTISILQSVNRGSVKEIYFNISGGTITTMYVGGEPDPEVDATIDDYVIAKLSDGTITNLLMGTDGGVAIPKTTDKIRLFVGECSIENGNEIFSIFGEKLLGELYYYSQDGELFLANESTTDTTIPKSVFGGIAKLDTTYAFNKYDDDFFKPLYSWYFKGEDITDPTIEVNTEITVLEEAPNDIKTDVSKLVPDKANVLYLDFAHSGDLPGKATIFMALDEEQYAKGDILYILHYNERTKKLENQQKLVVQQGGDDGPLFINFNITTCSTYLLSDVKITTNPDTSDNILFYVILFAVGSLGTGIVLKKKYSN